MNDEEKVLNIEDFIKIVKQLKDSFSGSEEISQERLDKIRKSLNSMKDSIEKSMEGDNGSDK